MRKLNRLADHDSSSSGKLMKFKGGYGLSLIPLLGKSVVLSIQHDSAMDATGFLIGFSIGR